MFDTEKQKIKTLYLALALCVIATSIPLAEAQNFGAVLTLVVLMTSYVLRNKATPDSPVKQHSAAVIRIIWMWSAVLIGGMIVAGLIISQTADMSMIDPLLDGSLGAVPDEAMIQNIETEFLTANEKLLWSVTVPCLAPAQLYAAWKLYGGLKAL